MRLCLLGKYPPIQGGVSTETFWIARGLAARGHEIHVVTNAPEVEPMYRIELNASDDDWYEYIAPDESGQVRVHAPAAFDPRALSYIPLANPFVSKLAGLATEVIDAHDCDVVLAYYFEPYAVAGWLAAQWTGKPLIVKHAGSDLDRLMRSPELATTYKRVLRSADVVVTQRGLMARFAGIGVPRNKLATSPSFHVPTEVFTPNRVSMIGDGDDAPRIGIYGKIGASKGTFDLVAALERLAADGLEFTLLAMIGAAQAELLAPRLRQAGIAERTRILPFAPHWQVPDFIRACTAVCFLERDFPISIHGPMVPREVLACGTCLVLSEEIAAKQVFSDLFQPGRNVVIVEDPKDHNGLAQALRPLIVTPEFAAEVGRCGYELSRDIEPESTFAAQWERIAEHATKVDVSIPMDAPTAAELLAPALRSVVAQEWPELDEELVGLPDAHDPFAGGLRWCDRVGARVAELPPGDRRAKLEEAVRYQHLRLTVACDRDRLPGPAFPVVDSLQQRALTDAGGLDLFPVRAIDIRIEEFDFDVSVMFSDELDGDDALAALPLSPLRMLFQPTPHLVPRELRINDATSELLARCDGSISTAQLVREMARWFGVSDDSAMEAVLGALERLYEADAIVFAHDPPTRDGYLALAGDMSL